MEEGSSNLARSSFFYFILRILPMYRYDRKLYKSMKMFIFGIVVHMYTWSIDAVASKSRLFRLRAKNGCPTFLIYYWSIALQMEHCFLAITLNLK